MTTLREPMSLKIYRAVSLCAGPVAKIALDRRLKAGKEDAARINERRGAPSHERPEGRLVWIHGASVGESLSVIPLIERLDDDFPETRFLVTTGTVTSAALMRERLPTNAIHQYIPLDHPAYVREFMDHWRPDAALFVESEFWPNLILAARKTAPFCALVNGRVSPKSFADWKSQPNAIKYLLSVFDVMIGQDQQNAERLEALSGRKVLMFGNLKNAAAPLPADEATLAHFKADIGERVRWLAASTHPGEEQTIVAAHKNLANRAPNLLTMIAPRHPSRGDEVAEIARAAGLVVAQRSKNEKITDETNVYVADTLGELGVFYRLCEIAFIGGSITPKGGHNPLEPARLGSAILHGPEVFNFDDTYRILRRAGGAALVRNDREMATAIRRLMGDEKTRKAMIQSARDFAEANARKTLDDIAETLAGGLSASVSAQ
ncbi:MAG: 3-deoxy-D-manno-octulosonic acid transferase [Pseudomonadota bacterium]